MWLLEPRGVSILHPFTPRAALISTYCCTGLCWTGLEAWSSLPCPPKSVLLTSKVQREWIFLYFYCSCFVWPGIYSPVAINFLCSMGAQQRWNPSQVLLLGSKPCSSTAMLCSSPPKQTLYYRKFITGEKERIKSAEKLVKASESQCGEVGRTQVGKKKRGCFLLGWVHRELAGLGTGMVVFNFRKRIKFP